MKLVPVKALPEVTKVDRNTRVKNKPLREYLLAFLKRGDKYARVDYDFDDYADEWSACSSIRWAVRHSKLPIGVRFRNREIYLVNLEV